jgi:hypothetical protein
MMNVQSLVGLAISAALILLASTGCAKTASSNINPSQVYTSYSLSYGYGGANGPVDPSTATLTMTATFNIAGSTGTYLVLDGQSGVAVNGSPLDENVDIIDQVTYQHVKDGATDADASAPYLFVYTANDGTQYQNTLNLPGAIQVTNSAGSSYPLTSPLRVEWSSATSVSASETVTAYLEGLDGTYFTQSDGATVTGTTGEAVIGTEDLQTAVSGPALLSICREQYGFPAQAPSIEVCRCSPKIPVTLK